MNIIRLLLIGGLVYFAMQQKKEGTKNMILIVTGLLAVCMLSKEGFTVDLNTRATTCSGRRVATAADTRGVTAATCTGSDDGTGTACALNAQSTGCAVDGGGCSFTAGQPAIAEGDQIDCTAADLVDGACPDGCDTDGGVALTGQERTQKLAEYFTGMSDVGLSYVGDGTVDITTIQNLKDEFTCGEGTNIKPSVKADAPNFDATPIIDLRQYLQCSAPPRPSPTPTPSVPSPPTPTPSASSYGGCTPSKNDGKTDSCGDFFDDWSHWEWRRDSKSPDPNKLCSRNDVLPNVYCM